MRGTMPILRAPKPESSSSPKRTARSQRRMRLQEHRQARNHRAHADDGRRRHAQHAAQAADMPRFVVGLFEFAQQLAGSKQERFACLRRHDVARASQQQRRAETRFELGNDPRHGRLRQPEFARRRGEAAGFGSAHEHMQFLESITHLLHE
jgi:hypothetical protein